MKFPAVLYVSVCLLQVGLCLPEDDSEFRWSSWTSWSRCSATCGEGVRSRRRVCITAKQEKPRCSGYPREHYICKFRDCHVLVNRTIDHREEQCVAKRNTPVYGETYQWRAAKSRRRNSCELLCQETQYGFLYNFGKMKDGTPCRGSKDICVAGHCSRVGCDGKVGSTAVPDNCKVCGGRNHNCIFYKNTFKQKLPDPNVRDYTRVATIPKGATYLKVEDKSSNYLAVAGSRMHYIINGNLKISQVGDYRLGGPWGTVLNYNRSYSTEVITADGPLKEDVNIMLIFRRENPGITYEYWVPVESHPEVLKDTQMLDHYKDQLLKKLEGNNTEKIIKVTDSPHQSKNGRQDGNEQLTPTKWSINNQGPQEANSTISKIQIRTGKTKLKQPTYSIPGHCVPCIRPRRSRIIQYCQSDFVIRAMVQSRSIIRNETRYGLSIIQTVKSPTQLTNKEYMWVPNPCLCPKLRISHEYLLMGQWAISESTKEKRMVLRPTNYIKRIRKTTRINIVTRKARCNGRKLQ